MRVWKWVHVGIGFQWITNMIFPMQVELDDPLVDLGGEG